MEQNIIDNFINENKDKDWSQEHKNILKYVFFKTNLLPNEIVEKLQKNNGNYKKIVREFEENQIIDIVLRQTDYTREIAYEKLKKENGDYIKVIKEYMGVKEKPELVCKSTNQKIFNEIRNFMDNSKIENDQTTFNNQKNMFIENLTKKTLDNCQKDLSGNLVDHQTDNLVDKP